MLCKDFGICGGCTLQNKNYSEQLENKEKFVHSLFSPLVENKGAFLPIIGCSEPFGYRNKMEFSFGENKAGEKFLGLRANRGRVINIDRCLICTPWMSELLKKVRSWWEKTGVLAYFPPKDKGTLRTLTVREGFRTQERMVVLTISGNPCFDLKEEDIFSFQEDIRSAFRECDEKTSIILRKQIIAKGTPTRFEERILSGQGIIKEALFSPSGKKFLFTIRSDAFFQTNTCQAEKIYHEALALAQIQKEDIVYDLYCGTGTISLFAAERAKKVIGIELVPGAFQDAIENKAQNGIQNAEFFLGDVPEVLARHPDLPKPDIVIVDPPRAGLMPNAVEKIINLNAKKIIYISCNPLTQAEDLKKLMEAGCKCHAVQPIDQFPQTNHVENIILLQ